MSQFVKVEDLSSAAQSALSVADLGILIEDAEARALGAAPCLGGTLTDQQRAQVVAIIRGAVTRAATADDRQMAAGPFTIGPAAGTSSQPRALLWPSEVEELQRVCSSRGRAYLGWFA